MAVGQGLMQHGNDLLSLVRTGLLKLLPKVLDAEGSEARAFGRIAKNLDENVR